MPTLHFRRLIATRSRPSPRPTAAKTSMALVPLAAALIIFTLAIQPACAQTSDPAPADWLPSSPPRPHGSLTDATQSSQSVQVGAGIEPVPVASLLGKLALTAGLLYAGLWGWARWSRRGITTPDGGRGGLIRVREKVSLGSGGYLYVVAFGSRNLLISAVGDRVSLLTGNAASEMEQMDTASFPAQSQELAAIGEVPAASPHLAQAAEPASDRVQGRLRDDSRRAADWERKRDALVRALQESVGS